jgi:hypothetical protein
MKDMLSLHSQLHGTFPAMFFGNFQRLETHIHLLIAYSSTSVGHETGTEMGSYGLVVMIVYHEIWRILDLTNPHSSLIKIVYVCVISCATGPCTVHGNENW